MPNHFALDHLTTFWLEGADAHAYAQSQFTASVDALASDLFSPLAWCDPKGRVIAFMMARLPDDERVELVVAAGQGKAVRDGLERYTIGRRVAVSATEPVAGSFDPDPATPRLSIDRTRGLLARAAAAGPDARALARWKLLDLCRGLPWLAPASSGRHLPQWLGLDELGALAWDKGCYPGQEVIARLRYRGSVKYRLRGLKLDAAHELPAHSRITDGAGASAGHWLGGHVWQQAGVGLGVVATRIDDGQQVIIDANGQRHAAQVTSPEALC